ncbi:MAG TPA: Wadjet anti-phage system protein JetD domain-containing protein [Candidatus Acidoferrales bacterium]|nr:Wadjet anti-phage system protein JetD domain-containing protein [Candidatus Acidoferrales bacterium]
MAKPILLLPDSVREIIARRYRNRRRHWLAGEDEWPMHFGLGAPDEREAQRQPEALGAWIAAWQTLSGTPAGAGEIVWRECHWRTLGTQRLPERLLLHNAESAAAWLGEGQRWQRASIRYRHLAARWPLLSTRLARYFDILADWDAAEIQRLEDLLAWLETNPRSNLYPRQLPIGGIDSKWLEGRTPLITDLVAALQEDAGGDLGFYERCGLRPLPHIVRLCVLDETLRQRAGGLGDITARLDDLAALDLPASRVFIVENLQTGLAFGDHPGSVVFMALGYGVGALGRLPWVMRAPNCTYWGDLDTHGLAILSRARLQLPHLESALMDEATLLRHRDLWVSESQQYATAELPLLTAAEQAVYDGLKQHRWGMNVRLEQERIPWAYAWDVLCGAGC